MATRRVQSPSQNSTRKSQVSPQRFSNVRDSVPLVSYGSSKHTSLIEFNDLSAAKKETISYDGYEYQLIPVEIPKDAEIGLVVGHIEGQSWVFIDEILPNGMIDMHGVLKEGDYLIQVGIYSLTNVNITTALLLIERAYDDGRNTLSFVAARQEKSNVKKLQAQQSQNKKIPVPEQPRRESRAQSFVQYENEEVEEQEQEQEQVQVKLRNSKRKVEPDTTHF